MSRYPKSITYEVADALKALIEEYREFGPHCREDGLYDWPGEDVEPVRLVRRYRHGLPTLHATARHYARLVRAYTVTADAMSAVLNDPDERLRLRHRGVVAHPHPLYRHLFVVRPYTPGDGLPLPSDPATLAWLEATYPQEIARLRRLA